jgi:hypothetical protein
MNENAIYDYGHVNLGILHWNVFIEIFYSFFFVFIFHGICSGVDLINELKQVMFTYEFLISNIENFKTKFIETWYFSFKTCRKLHMMRFEKQLPYNLNQMLIFHALLRFFIYFSKDFICDHGLVSLSQVRTQGMYLKPRTTNRSFSLCGGIGRICKVDYFLWLANFWLLFGWLGFFGDGFCSFDIFGYRT